MNEVEVEWVQVRSSGGAPLSRWEARLIKPMRSLVFAWIVKREGMWHLEIMLNDMRVRAVATYLHREKGMSQLERWIRTRWQRTIPDWGVDDPRGHKGRVTWPGEKHRMVIDMSRTYGPGWFR